MNTKNIFDFYNAQQGQPKTLIRVSKNKQDISGQPGVGDLGSKTPTKPLSYKQINEWSDWAEKNEKQGDDIWSLYDRFKKQNPKTDIALDDLRDELRAANVKSQDLSKRNAQDAAGFTTIGHTFPRMIIDGKDYGRINRDLHAENSPAYSDYPVPERLLKKQLPSNVDWSKVYYENGNLSWEDPETGDIVYGSKDILHNDKRVAEWLMKQKAEGGIQPK